ncbi:polysaccharide deacetylase family protein, partial [uncultured Variovorax sp.]|uniref:polysaccharide deacetylase family protein n=1 Tax=uncultured Variovorax sp. TaxID=114708 RepID=UPI0025CD945A
MRSASRRAGLATAASMAVLAAALAPGARAAQEPAACGKPVYLTFDTGHMGIAPLVADVLKRQDVRVTFFAAAERTQTDGDSLDDHWAPWWKARAAEGNEFGSHTYDHAYWRGDVKGTPPSFRIRPS